MLGAATLVIGCTSLSPSPATSALPTAISALASATPVATSVAASAPPTPTSVLPSAAPLAPSAVIDLPDASSAIPVVADGKGVWIGVDGAILHVNGQTDARTRITVPDMHTGNGHIAVAADGLWLASDSQSLIERVDPTTGSVELKASVQGPRDFIVVGKDMYVGLKAGGFYPVDRATGTLGAKIPAGWATSKGAFWGGSSDGTQVMRVDPATGAPLATIAVPGGSGCPFGESATGDIWSGCSVFQGADGPGGATVVEIDPNTKTVKSSLNVPGFSAVLVGDDALWFILPHQQDDGTIDSSLVAVDAATGHTTAVWDLGPLDADIPVMTSTAIWIPDEQGHRVLKFDLADLRP